MVDINKIKELYKNISIVSTCSARLFNSKYQGLWKGIQEHYPDINFYFYHENSFEKKQTGEFINFESMDVPKNYHTFDLFKLYSGLENFLKTSPFKDCHSMGTPNMHPDGTPTYWNRNSIYWFRKTPAIFHASTICKTPILIFLDADSVITPFGNSNEDEYTINNEYYNHAMNFDVCSRHRKPQHTETGHIIFNLLKRGGEFCEKFYKYYISGEAFKEKRWDDCWIFDTLVEKLEVSNGPLSKATGAPFDFEAIIDHHKGNFLEIRNSREGI